MIEWYNKVEKIPLTKLVYLPNCVDNNVTISSSVNKIKPKEDNYIIITTVARLVPQKGVSLLLEAICELKKRYPKIKFWIVGDGIMKKKLQ